MVKHSLYLRDTKHRSNVRLDVKLKENALYNTLTINIIDKDIDKLQCVVLNLNSIQKLLYMISKHIYNIKTSCTVNRDHYICAMSFIGGIGFTVVYRTHNDRHRRSSIKLDSAQTKVVSNFLNKHFNFRRW